MLNISYKPLLELKTLYRDELKELNKQKFKAKKQAKSLHQHTYLGKRKTAQGTQYNAYILSVEKV
jgi:hypothetical protein